MLTSILTIALGAYVLLIFVANFSEGQCDIECEFEYSWVSTHPRNTQDSLRHPNATRPTPSTFAIGHSQQTQNKTMA